MQNDPHSVVEFKLSSKQTKPPKNNRIVPQKGDNDYFNHSLSFLWTWSLTIIYLFTLWYFLAVVFPRIVFRHPSNWYNSRPVVSLPDLNKTIFHVIFMVIHIVFGFGTMFLGIMQISPSIRTLYNYRFHKYCGYVNIILTFITSSCGILFIFVNKFQTVGGINMSIAFCCGGIWFFTTAAHTLYYVRYNKNIKLHKQWALRLYAMSLGSVIYRLWFFLFEMLFNHETPSSVPDYLRFLDSLNAWLFVVSGEIVVETAILTKKHLNDNAKQRRIRGLIMDVLSLFVSILLAICFWHFKYKYYDRNN